MAGIGRLLAGVAVAALAVGFVVVAMGRFSGRGSGPPARPVDTVRVGHDSAVEVAANQYRALEFRLPARLCTLTGQVASAETGRGEFEALVLDDIGFRKWQSDRSTGSVRSGRTASWTPDVPLVGPGRYHLVIANFGPPAGPSRVTVDVRAACR